MAAEKKAIEEEEKRKKMEEEKERLIQREHEEQEKMRKKAQEEEKLRKEQERLESEKKRKAEEEEEEKRRKEQERLDAEQKQKEMEKVLIKQEQELQRKKKAIEEEEVRRKKMEDEMLELERQQKIEKERLEKEAEVLKQRVIGADKGDQYTLHFPHRVHSPGNSYLKERDRVRADDAYEQAKASYEESRQTTPVPPSPRKTTKIPSARKSTDRQRSSVVRSSTNSIRSSLITRREIDSDFLHKEHLKWIKNCMPWSETVASMRVASSKHSLPNKTNDLPVKLPSDCKSIPAVDLLLRSVGRGYPPLTSITALNLSKLPNQFDLSSLSSLPTLVCLDISYSNFTYLANLDSCQKLEYLVANNNKISSINVNRLVQLQFIDVSHNEISSLQGLSYCHQLMSLNASYNRLMRIDLSSPSTMYSQLHTLNLSNNQLLSTKEALKSFPCLVNLDLSSNNLRTLDSLSCLGILQFLNASFNSLNAVPDLSNNVLLIDLNLSGNNLRQIESVTNFFLPHLIRCDISRNMVVTLPNISHLFNLVELRIDNNQISTYKNLISCSQLTQLPRLKFIRADFLCFSAEDSSCITKELKQQRGIELISADYDSAVALCSSLKLVISSGLAEDQENGNDRLEADDDFLEFSRFAILLHDNLNTNLSEITTEMKKVADDNIDAKKKAAAIMKLFLSKWLTLKKYFEDSLKAANERRYGVEFGGDRSKSALSKAEEQPPKIEKKCEEKVKKPVSKSTTNLNNNEKNNEKKRREMAALKIQSGWRGFLARFEVARWHVAATFIQKVWRGYWVRKQLAIVLEQMMNEIDDEGDNITEVGEESQQPQLYPGQKMNIQVEDEDDFNDKSVEDLLSFVSGIQSATESIDLISARPGSQLKGDRHAWLSPPPGAQHQIDISHDLESSRLPSSLAQTSSRKFDDEHSQQQSSARLSKKAQGIQEEWGFADPTTVELMMKRANRMKQAEKRKKMAQMDANQRLAMARKHTDHTVVYERQNFVIESTRPHYPMKPAHVEQPVPNSPDQATARQQQTFAWVHSVVREPSPMVPSMNNAFPPITAGGVLTHNQVALSSHRSDQRRRIGDDSFPPILHTKPSSAASNQSQSKVKPVKVNPSMEQQPKKRDLIRAWREPQIRMSGGWGGGRSLRTNRKH